MKLQYNLTTNAPYQGNNQARLQEVKEERGYQSDAWITFVQARTIGKKLVNAKGKGVFLKTFTNETKENEKGKTEKFNRPVGFVVFNADHLEDIK